MNTKLIEILIPVLIRILELLLNREERKDDDEAKADRTLAEAARNHYGSKSDAEIIEEAFA